MTAASMLYWPSLTLPSGHYNIHAMHTNLLYVLITTCVTFACLSTKVTMDTYYYVAIHTMYLYNTQQTTHTA